MEEPISQSPRPNNMPMGMDFPTIMKAVVAGQSITKLEWMNKDIYGVLKDGFSMLHKEDGKFYQWVISDGDLQGKDWVVCELPMNRAN